MPTTVYKPLDSPVSALRNKRDRISDARLCCQSWVSASFAVMASLAFHLFGSIDPRTSQECSKKNPSIRPKRVLDPAWISVDSALRPKTSPLLIIPDFPLLV